MHVSLQNMSQPIWMFELHNRILEHSGKKVQIMSDRHIPEQCVRKMRKLPIFVHHMLQQHLLHYLQRRILSLSEYLYRWLGNLLGEWILWNWPRLLSMPTTVQDLLQIFDELHNLPLRLHFLCINQRMSHPVPDWVLSQLSQQSMRSLCIWMHHLRWLWHLLFQLCYWVQALYCPDEVSHCMSWLHVFWRQLLYQLQVPLPVVYFWNQLLKLHFGQSRRDPMFVFMYIWLIFKQNGSLRGMLV